MSDNIKPCRFYSFIRCECGNCSACGMHPLNNPGTDYFVSSERAALLTACTVWLRNNNLPVTHENVLDALCMTGCINAAKARDLIAKNPPALSDSLKERRK